MCLEKKTFRKIGLENFRNKYMFWKLNGNLNSVLV